MMPDILVNRADAVAKLMKRAASLAMAVQVREEDGSVWLYGPGDCPGRKIGGSARDAVLYLERVEVIRHAP